MTRRIPSTLRRPWVVALVILAAAGLLFLFAGRLQQGWQRLTLPQSPSPAAPDAAAPDSVATDAAGLAPFTVATWNVGLDDADPALIAQLLAAYEGVDLWGLAEVNPQAADQFARAAQAGEDGRFGAVLGSSGDSMRLLALYNEDRYALLDWQELEAVNTTGNARAPLVLHLAEEAGGQEFLLMVNHLYRSRDGERLRQARLLAEWAAAQPLPVIAVGDYNVDWAVEGGENDHDPAYDALTAGGAWQWVQPATLVTTQCSGWPCRYDTVLDFVFTAGPAQGWPASSQIAVIPGDFPDDTRRSDHRAVLASFAPAAAADLAGERVQIPHAIPAPSAGSQEADAAAVETPGQGAQGTYLPASPWPPAACAGSSSPPPDPACPIKGNISSERIYHTPGQRDYCATVIDESRGERWFCSPQEARAAGWRPALR